MSDGGWISVYRRLLSPSHDLHPSARGEEACRAFAWIDLLGMARWQDGGGLERGQCRIKQRQLATRWNWSRGKVRRFLNELEEKGRIVTDPRVGPKPTILTVCNYDTYQEARPNIGPLNGPRSGPTPIMNNKNKNSARSRARGNGKKTCGKCGRSHTSRLCPRCYSYVQGRE